VILHALEPDPEKRYASAAQVAFDLSHGDQVALGPRAHRKRRVAGLGGLLRWVAAAGFEPPMYPSGRPSAQVSGASIIMAAVATAHHNEAQFEAQRLAVRRLMGLDEHTRLAAVTSIPPAPELGNEEEVSSTSQRIQQLVLLRNWAESLDLPASRITFHVLESGDPAEALLDYARMNQVDHIVIGAPPPDLPLKGVQRTVAAKVALEAPCTVTMVRSNVPVKKAEFPW
jgi:nucleotide-binding universal stress UspA family protein